MKYLWKNSRVALMHIELTNYCNAACPFCPRFVDATDILRPDLNLEQISIDQFKNWFPAEALQNMQRILFCGTHGDPMMSKDLLEIVRYIRESSKKTVLMFNTNGGMRKPDFWKELGNILKEDPAGVVTFSIDGLEDTNHLYRRNVKWDQLIENVEAFTSTGARAWWDYLTFKHNEHQIEEARELAKKLKFEKFLVKRALGFEDPNGGYKSRGIYDRNGDLAYVIEPPTDGSLVNVNEYKNSSKQVVQKIDLSYLNGIKETREHPGVKRRLEEFTHENIPPYNQYIMEHEQHKIKCKSDCSNLLEKKTEIYVSCHGIVFPCCYIGTRVDSTIDLYEDTQLRYSINQVGKDNFNLNKRSFNDIIDGGWLDEVYTKSWDIPKFKDGRLSYCAMTCGEKSQIDKIYVDGMKKNVKKL